MARPHAVATDLPGHDILCVLLQLRVTHERPDMPNDYTHDHLTKKLNTPGWQRSSGATSQSGTLEEMARGAHADRANNPGVVKEIETGVELEMIQLQKLWHYLGLPV